jgi:hypothetical protein
MKYYEATSTINASPQAIWQVLVDGAGYASWDSGVVSVTGRIAPGETITVISAANPGRTFPVKVTEFTPGRKMVWPGGMPLGLFKGVRSFTLVPDANGLTRFTMREEYTGPLSGLIWRSIPNLQPSFDTFAQGLKAQAERAVAAT